MPGHAWSVYIALCFEQFFSELNSLPFYKENLIIELLLLTRKRPRRYRSEEVDLQSTLNINAFIFLKVITLV